VSKILQIFSEQSLFMTHTYIPPKMKGLGFPIPGSRTFSQSRNPGILSRRQLGDFGIINFYLRNLFCTSFQSILPVRNYPFIESTSRMIVSFLVVA